MTYEIESINHVGPWGEPDGTSYFVVDQSGKRVAKCDSFEDAESIRGALEARAIEAKQARRE